MRQPAVSVLVPIYNVEKYLRQCLDSIVGQTFKDLEIILINDGSKDGSLDIVKEYAARDDRIKVIDKPNEGYGKTMNRGLEAARGEYIGIIESDDWVEPDMYEKLYALAKSHDLDVVKSSFIPFNDQTGRDERIPKMPECDVERIINPRQNPTIFYYQSCIWSAIYKRDFLNENGIRFLGSPGASYQDTGFNFKVWAMADKAYFTNTPLIHYRVGHAGQSVKSKEKVFCVCEEFEEIERYLSSRPPLFKKMEKIFNRAKFHSYSWNLGRLDGENRDAFLQRMQAEFVSVMKSGAIDFTGMTSKNRLKFLKAVYPNSNWLKIKYMLGNLTRWLVKDRLRSGYMETRILFGLIPIRKKSLTIRGAE